MQTSDSDDAMTESRELCRKVSEPGAVRSLGPSGS